MKRIDISGKNRLRILKKLSFDEFTSVLATLCLRQVAIETITKKRLQPLLKPHCLCPFP